MPEIDLDVVTRINRAPLDRAAGQIQRDMQRAGREAGNGFTTNFAQGIEGAAPRVQAATVRVTEATRKLREEQMRLNEAMRGGNWDNIVTQSERLERAHRDHESSLRSLTEVQSLASSSAGTLASSAAEAGSAMSKAAGPAGAGALAIGLQAAVSVASSLSGLLGLLPGAALAAAAGFATLKIGTQGFTDALGAMDDPQKFAQAIAGLSPNAARAATDIRSLVDGPLADLKRSTQDALFAGVGPQLQQLTTAIEPSLQRLTTTVATSFNQMFSGITGNPAILKSIETTMDNIGAAFTNLAPAAQPFTQAIAKLAEAGSSFLPGLATGITDAANAFSKFITEAQQSGQLQQWIQEGIDTAKAFGPIILDVGKAFLSMDAGGKSAVQAIGQLASAFATLAPALNGILSYAPEFMTVLGPSIAGVTTIVDGLGKGFDALTDIVANVVRQIIPLVNRIGTAVSDALEPVRQAAKLVGMQIPEYKPLDPNGPARAGTVIPKAIGAQPTGSAAADKWLQADQAAHPLNANGLPPGTFRKRDGTIGYATPPSLQTGGIPQPLSGPYAATTSGSGTGVQAPQSPLTGDPMSLLGGVPVTASLYGAATSVLQSRHDVEQQRALVDKLEKSNVATQDEITKAKNELLTKQQQQTQAEMRLQEEKQSATDSALKQMNSAATAFGDIGNALDKDFGISKGLPGLADNLTRFLGNLATAGFRGQLKAIEAADPDWQARLAAANGSSGTSGGYSPFGPTSMYGSQYGSPGYGYGAPGQAMAGESARDFAHRVEMPYFQQQGLTVGDHAADQFGEHQNGAIDIMVSSFEEGAKVLQQVLSDPNTYGAIFNKTSYGYGKGTAGTPMEDRGSPTANHMDHVHAYFKPGGTNNIIPGGGAPSFGPPIGSPFPSGPALGASPVAPPIGWGPGGIASPLGAGGQGFGVGQTPGMAGQAAGAPIGAPVGGPAQGGWQPAATSSSGIGAAAGAAAAMAFPGAGEAAAKAGQLVDRSVKYLGQLSGIGISGLMETFGLSDPNGGGNLQQSWLGRVAGGLAQASPSMPSSAGQAKGDTTKQVDPNTKEHGTGGGQAPGPHNSGVIVQGDFVMAPNRNGQKVLNDMAFASAAKGSR